MNVYSITIFFAVILLIFYLSNTKKLIKYISNDYFILILIGFLVRAYFIFKFGYTPDMSCFRAWAENLYKHGIKNFYYLNIFKDYPPGYMYVLYLLGAIKRYFSLSENSMMILLKLPSVISDIICGIFLYKIFVKQKKNYKSGALVFSLAYILNPAVILDSSVWGQIDSFYTLIIFAVFYFLTEKKYIYGFVLYAYAISLKPQSFMFIPIILYIIYEILSQNKFNKRSIYLVSQYILSFVLSFILLMMPFTKKINFMPILNVYKNSLKSYSYLTLNAFNLYEFLNLNWFSMNSFGLYSIFLLIEIIICVAISLFVIYVLFKSKNKYKYYFSVALINILVFMLSFKIHERYIFPALLFLLMTYVYEQKKKLLFLYGGFSVVFFINCVNIYQKWVPGKTPIVDPLLGKLFSLANIILTIILIIFSMNNYVFANTNDKKQKNKINIFEIKSRNIKKLAGITKKDYIIMFIISFIYAIVAFSNLGDHKFPKTFLKTKKESNAIIDFNSQQYLKRIQVLNGVRPDKKISLYFSDDCINWRDNTDFEFKGVTPVFKWEEKKLGVQARYVNIVFKDDDMYVYEIAFRDNENKILPIKIIFNDDAKNIFDEQNLVPESSDYKNSTYFDEVYHARTGFEFLNRLKAYETTHPPLGKDIIALGIKIFGMNPFGWRFFGTLFGVLMLPAFYYLAKKIFSRTLWATFATVLFASDFMHFVQTRIATVDSYTLFFIILMFTSMFIYCHLDFFDDKQKINNISTLIFCAIFTGLACATKWQGFYALAGLIIIFIMNLNLNYRKALKDINLKNKFKNRAILQINLCMFLFVFISLTIYFASYFLYIKTDGVNNNFSSIIKNQLDMFSYHAFLKSSHPFGSKWWQWVLNLRPILFYNHTFSTNVHTGISSFLNPVVCYGGLIGIFYCIAYLTYIFDANIAFVLIAYLSGLVPWMLIKRVTFEYHYFPCSPFLILLFTFFVRDIIYPKFGKRSVIFLSSVSIILFAMFYPVLVGLPVSDKYVNMILKWFPSWNLI